MARRCRNWDLVGGLRVRSTRGSVLSPIDDPVGCQKSIGCHAARSYSWMTPPRTSWRSSCRAAADGSACSQHSDGSRPTSRGHGGDDGGCNARHRGAEREQAANAQRSGDDPGTPGARCQPGLLCARKNTGRTPAEHRQITRTEHGDTRWWLLGLCCVGCEVVRALTRRP
jgi:hypothetical protein